MNASNSSFQRNWVSMLIANGKQYRYRGSNFRIEPFPRTPQFRRLKGTCFRIQKYKLSTLKMRYKVEKISLSLYISTTCYLARSLWIISFAKEESSEKKTGGDYFGNPDIAGCGNAILRAPTSATTLTILLLTCPWDRTVDERRVFRGFIRIRKIDR